MLIIPSLTELRDIVRKCNRFDCAVLFSFKDLWQVHVPYVTVLHRRWLQIMKLSTMVKCEFPTKLQFNLDILNKIVF